MESNNSPKKPKVSHSNKKSGKSTNWKAENVNKLWGVPKTEKFKIQDIFSQNYSKVSTQTQNLIKNGTETWIVEKVGNVNKSEDLKNEVSKASCRVQREKRPCFHKWEFTRGQLHVAKKEEETLRR